MGNISQIFGRPYQASDPLSPDVQLRTAMAQLDLYPQEIVMDGNIHRFPVEGSKDAGWYVAYGDGVPAGKFGNWKLGEELSWVADVGRKLTTPEMMAHAKYMAEIKKKRDAEKEKKKEIASNSVSYIWDTAGLASDDHPYLKRKGVKSHGLRITGDGRLVAPLYNKNGEMLSVQYISSDGVKRFHPGSVATGCFHMLGDPDDIVYVAEGFATGATIYEATGKATAITYSAGNILHVVESIRNKSNIPITIIADKDKGGLGQAKAEQAAAKYGARVIVSPVESDVNDFVQGGGDLLSLLNPLVDEWLTHVSDFCKKPAPIKWLVKHWIQSNAMIMVHGPSGCGKTFVVLDWCLRIASGSGEWMGKKVKKGSVVYLAGEGHHGLRGRVAAWMQKNPHDDIDMFLSKTGTDLNTPEGLNKTITAIRQTHEDPSIIVVDTLHRFLDGDENSAQDTKTMLDACAVLMNEFSCSVLLVHHTGVNAEAQHRARGSSAWKGALDIEISIEKKDRDPAIKVIQRKNKDSELAIDEFLELETVPINGWFDEDGDQVTSAVVVEGEEPVGVNVQNGKDKAVFFDAWISAGKERMHDTPYLLRSMWREYLTQNGKSVTAARQAVKPSAGGLASRLIAAGIIAEHDHGFLVIDGTFLSQCNLGTNGTN